MSIYLRSIQTGVLIFFIFAILMLIPYMIFEYRKLGRVYPWRFILVFSFFMYIIVAYALTIFPLPDPSLVAKMTGPVQNLHPFEFVRDFLKYSPFRLTHPGTWIAAVKAPTFVQPVFNLLLTLPFGFYLRYLYRRNWKSALILSFLLTLSFESIQRSALFGLYPRPYRLFDVDDLFLNTLGAMIGFGLTSLIITKLPDLNAIRTSEREQVSLTRRAVAFFVDLLLTFLIGLFVNVPYVVELLFFLMAPLIFGRTLGQMLLKLKISGSRVQTFLRQILSGINFLPLILAFIFLARSGTIPERNLGQNFLLILLSMALNLLPLADILVALLTKSRRLWYERVSQTKIESVDYKNQ